MPTAPRTIDILQLTFDRIKSVVTCRQTTRPCQLSVVRKSKGFTLIELLIVITIIGILASLTLASYGSAQAKARDGVRKSDLAQVKRALELAKADCQGNAWYPWFSSLGSSGTSHGPAVTNYGTSAASGTSTLRGYLTAAALTYMSSVPLDPKDADNSGSGGSDNRYGYNVSSVSTTATVCPSTAGVANSQYGASNFLIAVQLERKQDADAANSQADCTGKPNIANYNSASGGWYVICNN